MLRRRCLARGMRRTGATAVVLALCAWASGEPPALVAPPAWAYVVNPPNFKEVEENGGPLHVPDSTRTFLPAQVDDLFFAPDWHPAEHAEMPEVVARGRRPGVYACGFCHRADGSGGPENASLSGLPAAYIEEQIAEFRSGARGTSVPSRVPPKLMIALTTALTKAEIKEAAGYFASVPAKSRIKVVETPTVPVTHVAGWFLATTPGGGTEPIGPCIIEVPEDLAQFKRRDSHVRFVAYVPPGSVKAGETLVKSGGVNAAYACANCHGANLAGLNLVPRIAGRSPSYVFRQLYDFRSGARAGPAAAPMQQVVQGLTPDTMISIAAYLATLD